MTLPGWLQTPIDVAVRTLRLFTDGNGLSWAGALGLYLFLSVPPLMVASAYIASFFVAEFEAQSFVLVQASKYVPARSELLQSVIVRESSIATSAGIVSLLFLLVSGSRTFAALASGINRMWRCSDRLSFFETQLARAGLLLLAFALLALTGALEFAIGAVAPAHGAGGQTWLLEWQVLPFFVLALFLFIAYRVLPQTEVPTTHAAIGALLATVGVRIAQAVMGWMSEAGTFETPYGALAGVGLMATWALVVGMAVLLGAALVATLAGVEPDGQQREPSGTGREQRADVGDRGRRGDEERPGLDR